MPSYTVTMLEREKPWSGDYGAMIDYTVTLKDSDGKEHAGVVVAQKEKTPPVTVGQTLTGTVEPGKWGPKFKKEQLQGGGGGGGFRPRDPKETAAIQRQHSQEMALRFMGAIDLSAAVEGKSASEVLEQVLKPLISWFQRDIDAGVNLAMYGSKEEKRKEPTRTGASDVPAKPEEFVHLPDDGKGTPFEV